jgi:probable F420-dependent oxidoreductase
MDPRNNAPTLSMLLVNWADTASDWGAMLARARIADEVGIDRLIVSDHVVLGERLDRYPRGRFHTAPSGQWLEPLTTLSVVAGLTTRIRLSTGIVLAALRRPVVFAKAAATLDVLSNGRLDLGVGVGWQKEEYDAAGVTFAERGRALDATLECCRRMWAPGPVEVNNGRTEPFRVWCEPKPRQPNGIPIWVSGRPIRAVLDRIVRYGDGWIPWAAPEHDIRRDIGVVHDALAAGGRATTGFAVRATLPVAYGHRGRVDLTATLDAAAALATAGVSDFALGSAYLAQLPNDASAFHDELARLITRFRATVA